MRHRHGRQHRHDHHHGHHDGCRFAHEDGGGRRGGRHGHRGDHGGGHGGGHRGGRRAGRLFDHGELRYVVLALIAEQPRHGYELIKEIEDRVAGTYTPSPGVIYPTLTLLEELGHATVTEEGGKKRYAITEEGTAFLEGNRPAADAAMARMDAFAAQAGSGPDPQVVRAMENLKLAMRLRMARGPLNEDQARVVAAALDAAALAVEQS
ncbi:PadR family transcriptional regulator [Thalassobaculum sp. OXR-137]|uniref:PadR family transcriptional regulator n=1 Tax=Thalassobaculum sp. OXR-137 TaxID=3100173 RepID=UPI002AC9D228|nr:PadR family transcriptional regulator [Thalassobaculum sp. OXR-137]WPZ33644.1 PadR family transcriptional regulator [Thalassobaculum sp. OXR-137]